jgi:hypothetical protein
VPGTSADCIPVVEKFRNSVREIKEYLDKTGCHFKHIRENINSLFEEIQPHPTLDIYAKKLYLIGKKEQLSYLKQKIVLFFYLLQYFKPPDERYDKFFASIIKEDVNGDFHLPDDVEILTLNYDLQLEISYQQFIDVLSLDSIQKDLGIFPRPILFGSSKEDVQSGFSVTRLNGSACYLRYDSKVYTPANTIMDFNYINRIFTKGNIKTGALDNLNKLFRNKFDDLSYRKALYNDLTFCWEKNELAKKALERAKIHTSQTKKLIIIGYSFPYVNRDFDDDIIQNMKYLEKVTIQDPMEDSLFQQISNRLKLITNNADLKVDHLEFTKEFVLPE